MMDDTTRLGSIRESVTLRRVAHTVGLLVLIAILLPFVVYAVPQIVGADHGFVVLSGSMEPTLSPGDVIIVDDVPAEQIHEGDVISFTAQGETRTTTHRVIEVVEGDGGPQFRTKGDANEDPDRSLVSPSQVQGRVVSIGGYLFVIPKIGYVIQFANTQTGIVALVLVPITLLVLNEVWNIVSSTREDGAETDENDESTPSEPVLLLEADGGDPDGDSDGEESSAGDGEEGLTLRPVELRLGLVAMVAFTAYSAWVAYNTVEVWSIGVAASVGVATLLLAGLYFFGGSAPDDESDEQSGDGPGIQVRYGTPSDEADQQPVQPVAGFETLLEIARSTGGPVIRDDVDEMTYLPAADALYQLEGPSSDQWRTVVSNSGAIEDGAGGSGESGDSGTDEADSEEEGTDSPGSDVENDDEMDADDVDAEATIVWNDSEQASASSTDRQNLDRDPDGN